MLNIIRIPALKDNYIWLLHKNAAAIVVDPGEARPVRDALQREGLRLSAILITALGMYLRRRGARTVIDKETGNEIHLVRRHDMFWIPIKWWACVWAFVGVWFAMRG